MTHEDLERELTAIQAELQEPSSDKVSKLVPFTEAMTEKELVELLHKISEIQVSQGAMVYPAGSDEIMSIVEAIKKPSNHR